MKRILAVAAVALSTGAAAQMMGGMMSTSGYFPMVDGARYDYVHSGGPWASSTVDVRCGQSWAGQQGLCAMHSTYMCTVGVACAPDATDFYGRGPGGMFYYGGTGADPAGSHFSMMSLAGPEWVIKDPLVPGTMMAGGGYGNAERWTTAVNGTGSMMGAVGYMSSYFAQDLETVTVPAGTFANALHVREQRGSGAVRDVWYAQGVGMVMMDDGTQVMRLAGFTMPGGATVPGVGATLPFMPFTGMWWNPDESGTGYNLQIQHGVMVMTMFSYNSTGTPVWYYSPGRLVGTGAGVTMSGSLERYSGGQCASCAYARPTMGGSDGAFSIEFSSATSATLHLPGGRTTRIVPLPW